MKISDNIRANIGSVSGLSFQNNGTERLKGSYPVLVTDAEQIESHLSNDITNILQSFSEGDVSRVSSRYFVTESAIPHLKNFVTNEVMHFHFQLEAQIVLGNIFEEIEENIYWIWVGGNIKERVTSQRMREKILSRLHQTRKAHTYRNQSGSHELVLFGSPNIIQSIDDHSMLPTIKTKALIDHYANQISSLFRTQLPVYVTDNKNPFYIKNTIANNEQTRLFAALNKKTDTIDAVVANEFTDYPVVLPSGVQKFVRICESNDWVKRRGVSSDVFYSLLSSSLKEAQNHKPILIEAECVPEAFQAAINNDFVYAGLLERTSHMKTDGENIELYDERIPEKYRKFNSLFLFYIKR